MQIRTFVKRQYRNVLSFLLLILRKDGDTVKDKLNARQKKFSEYYVQSGNIVQSAIKAGYIDNKEKYTLK
ncbi:terminase small subunit, partial [Pseudoruminococcus massiliensis]|uniref:terminase small subunit n=1 Tax=Pseudoruminococcus massiliensis TaxID=2086583 RepID=UPI003C6E30A7